MEYILTGFAMTIAIMLGFEILYEIHNRIVHKETDFHISNVIVFIISVIFLLII